MIVSDASPLIFLAKVNKLSLLKELFKEVLIEEEVRKEVVEKGKEENSSDALIIEKAIKESWIKVEKLKKKKGEDRKFKSIHEGEENSILLAKKHKSLLLIDEEEGREIARVMGLKARGTLYVLKKGVEKNVISKKEAIETLDELIEKGNFRISPEIYGKFLKMFIRHSLK